MKKRGVMGEGILMVYRLLLVAFVAMIVLGVSSIFYEHYIDVRDAEARIMARGVVDCFTEGEIVHLDDSFVLFEDCGIKVADQDRFFVRVNMSNDKWDIDLSQGDSGLTWIRDFFATTAEKGGSKMYEPGYYRGDYVGSVFVDEEIDVNMTVEVLIKDEL